MSNKYKGSAEIVLEGKTYNLAFDMNALSELHTEFERHLNDQGMLDATKVKTIDELVTMTKIGLSRHHPEVTCEAIKKASPPLMLLRSALDLALAYSYFGPELFDAVKKEATEKEKKEDKKAKPVKKKIS